MISEPIIQLAQTVHLSCIETNTVSKRTETSFHLSFHPVHLKQFSEPMVRMAQTMHLSCTKTNTTSKKDRKEILHDPRHLGVPSGASKIISEAMVHLVQTMDLCCTETNTISKWTETRFYMTHVT
jgi:hypothetical protein